VGRTKELCECSRIVGWTCIGASPEYRMGGRALELRVRRMSNYYHMKAFDAADFNLLFQFHQLHSPLSASDLSYANLFSSRLCLLY
jgi:hypothetical protein